MQDVDVVRNVRQLGLSMDGPAAYLLGVRPIERSRRTKPISYVDTRSWLPARDGALSEDGYECWRTASGFGVASRRAHGAAGCRRRVVMGFVASRDCVPGVDSIFVARAILFVARW